MNEFPHPADIDTIHPVVQKGSLWKLSHDTTAEMQSITFGQSDRTSSFFTAKIHSAKNQGPVLFHRFQPDWVTGILLMCFILLAWVQFFYPKRLRQILVAPYSKRFLNQLVREGKLFSERISVALGLIYLFVFPLMIYQVYDLVEYHKYDFLVPGFTVYLVIIVLFLLFWIIKILLIKFLGSVFKTNQSTSEYILNILLFNFLIGLLLLPLLVLVVYQKSVFFLQICLIITVLLFILSFIRGFLIGFSLTKYSYLFLFVYLCSLELLPFIVLMKLFKLYF
jgi:hypothetical protein